MQDVRTTINDSLRNAGLSEYREQAEPVIRALEAREQEIVRGLVEAGRRLGGRESDIRAICGDLGMSTTIGYTAEQNQNVTPMPQRADGQMTAQESGAPRSLEALVDALSERVDALSRRVDAAIQRAGLRL